MADLNKENDLKIETEEFHFIHLLKFLSFKPCGANDPSEYSEIKREAIRKYIETGEISPILK